MEIIFNVIAACVTAAHSPIREILEKGKEGQLHVYVCIFILNISVY